MWGPFLRRRIIHADPHPGNYVILDDGRLAVLDFGATKELSIPFAAAYWDIVTAALRREPIDIFEVLQETGFSFGEDAEATRVWCRKLGDIVERPMRRDFYDWRTCEIALDARTHYLGEANTAVRVRGPAESLMFYRAAIGLGGDFRMLAGAGNYRRVLQEVVDTAWESVEEDYRQGVINAGVNPNPWLPGEKDES